MKVEIKKIEVVEEIVLAHTTVPKGTSGEIVIKTDESGIQKSVIFAIPRKESSFITYYKKCFTDLTPEISEKIKEME